MTENALVRIMHSSMQFSDNKEQKQHDAKAIFDRAAAKQTAWVSGTEAGEEPLTSILREQAATHGYTFVEFKSLWLAVRRELIAKGSYAHDSETVVDNDLTVGAGHDTSLLWAQFTNPDLGAVTAMVSHYPRFGRPGAHDPKYRVNLKWTQKIAHAIGDKAGEFGKGRAIVFYAGDQNIPDNISDTFFGEPMTSCWDELDKHPSTGHGNIDVIASYNKDGRVKCVAANSLDDKEFPLFTDHFTIEAVYEVGPAKKPK